MVTGGNSTCCGEHFIMCVIINSLCGTPETNIILHINFNLCIYIYFNFKNVRKKKFHFVLNEHVYMYCMCSDIYFALSFSRTHSMTSPLCLMDQRSLMSTRSIQKLGDVVSLIWACCHHNEFSVLLAKNKEHGYRTGDQP